MTKRATFGSRFGTILVSVGSAVGLGNIWRFPYEAGLNGGGAYLVVYLACVLLLGLPLMMTEFFVGRHTRVNAVQAFGVLSPHRGWKIIGYMGILGAFMILGFYSVVSGWTLEYIWEAASGAMKGKTASMFADDYTGFITHPWRPLLWLVVTNLIAHLVIVSGVKKGIERASKLMMPLLFIILVVLCVRSLTLQGAGEGLAFLFKPDFSAVTHATFLSALGQAFFSLSLGMTTMITYSSYFDSGINIRSTALSVTLLDTMVAILAGVMIFPAVFSFGISPGQGPGLVFVTLPNIFAQLPLPGIWSVAFFVLLALASLTSIISIYEPATAYLSERFRLPRSWATLIVTLSGTLLGVFASLSLGSWQGISLFGMSLFDFLDYASAKVLMPLGSMLLAIFVGWRVDKKVLARELSNNNTLSVGYLGWLRFTLRYVAPILIALIFLYGLGLFGL
jgi:NSS family neurotransmitter:Na+ symporter